MCGWRPMIVTRALLVNVRSHAHTEVALAPGLNIIHGRNGAGKTSVLEGISLALQARSPRTARATECIRRGADFLRTEVELAADPECDLAEAPARTSAAFALAADGSKRLFADSSPIADPGRWEQLAPLSVFLPDDLRLVKGGPGRRRDFMDALFAGRFPEYRETADRYAGALAQRNSLLQAGVVDEQHDPWEAILAREGHRLVELRTEGLAEFARVAALTYRAIGVRPDADLRLVYRTNAAELDVEAYRSSLAARRLSDRRLSFTHLGPHRDDMRLVLGGVGLREAGSQGEQRSALLALLLARREWTQRGGGRPILLLDDVMSELDAERRRTLLALLAGCGQSVITTTDLHHFTETELASAHVVTLERDGAPSEGGRG